MRSTFDREDPDATARALTAAGYDLHWRILRRRSRDGRPDSEDLDTPLARTRVLSIIAATPDGKLHQDVRSLRITITPVDRTGMGTMLPPGRLRAHEAQAGE